MREREKRRNREKDLNQKFCTKQFLSDLFFPERFQCETLYQLISSLNFNGKNPKCIFVEDENEFI